MQKRRFIAGAKCPQCHAQDCIVMLTDAQHEWIECIECSYTEKRPTEVEYVQTIESNHVGIVQFKK